MNVVHGARQSNLTLVDHAPQNRTALADAFNGQHHIFIGHGLDKFIVLRRSVGIIPGHGSYRRFDVGKRLGEIAQDNIVTGSFDGTAFRVT